MSDPLRINRAPVLTLWAVVVGERLGLPRATALGCGHAVAGMNAYSKGVRLGIYAPPAERPHEPPPKPAGVTGAIRDVHLLGRIVHVGETQDGPRAISKGEVPPGVASGFATTRDPIRRRRFGDGWHERPRARPGPAALPGVVSGFRRRRREGSARSTSIARPGSRRRLRDTRGRGTAGARRSSIASCCGRAPRTSRRRGGASPSRPTRPRGSRPAGRRRRPSAGPPAGSSRRRRRRRKPLRLLPGHGDRAGHPWRT